MTRTKANIYSLFLLTCLVGLAIGLYLIISPFLLPFAWAVVLVLPCWPLYRKMCSRWPKHEARNAFLIVSLLALVIISAVAPLLFVLEGEAESAVTGIKRWAQAVEPRVPQVLLRIPVLGETIGTKLQTLVKDRGEVVEILNKYQDPLLAFATAAAKGLFSSVVTLTLALFISFFLFRNGLELTTQLNTVARKLGGTKLQGIIVTAAATMKGSVYGVLLTAIVQGILGGIGYAVAGAPVPVLFGFLTTVMALLPYGTPFVYIPVAVLTVVEGAPVSHGVLLGVWGVAVVSMIDNILRPIFISQASQMPFLLSFFGVLGGLISFGLIGLVLGPAIAVIALVLWREAATKET